jgi:hypothetical protein
MDRRATSLVVCGALALFSSVAAVQPVVAPDTPVGAWNVTIEFDGFPPCTAPALNTADGGVIANACTNLESPGYGQWVKIPNRKFAITFVGLEFAPDGQSIGTYKVRAEVTLTKDGTVFSGPFTADIFDTGGHVTFTISGMVRATRVAVEPL